MAVVGQVLAHYRIIDKIGEGGMGVVYKAMDTHLDRTIALKLLPSDKIADPDRRRRFVREAKAASALNHPNIVTVYDAGEDAGSAFIAMEYVEGKTLDKLIRANGLSPADAVAYAGDIARALATAHSAGIIHRDLKPSNVMVTNDRIVKLLDFGLAKVSEADDAVTRTFTKEGTILGTVGYMSPEQAAGSGIDARSDVFSFGAVLYEMLTGRRAFTGTDAASVIASILRDEPEPIRGIAPAVPAALETLIGRCLHKARERRWQSMADVSLQLEDIRYELESRPVTGVSVAASNKRPRVIMYGAIALASATVAFGVWMAGIRSASDSPPRTSAFTSLSGEELWPAISSDGDQVAFSWNSENRRDFDLYIKLVGAGDARQLTREPASDDTGSAWSPDGRFIAFYREVKGSPVAVHIIPALGGREQKLTESAAPFELSSAPTWSVDGKFVVIEDQPSPEDPRAIYSVSRETGEKHRLTSPPKGIYGDRFPAFSPDGSTLAFSRFHAPYTSGSVHMLPMSGGSPSGKEKPITSLPSWGVDWTPDGRSVVLAANFRGVQSLWRVLISRPTAAPERLPGVGDSAVSPSVSRRGNRLVYASYWDDWNIWRVKLGPSPAPATRLTSSTRADRTPAISPDGRRVAFSSSASGSDEIWICDADGSNLSQLTSFGGPRVRHPQWSADSRLITFDSLAAGHANIYVLGLEGVAPKELTTDSSNEERPSWSFDGRWIYFRSDRTGRWEIWKTPIAGGPAVQVTRDGGYEAFESAAGAVYYVKRDAPGLWMIPKDSGHETLVLDGIRHGQWTLSAAGIYWITTGGAVQLARFKTSQSIQVASISPEALRYDSPSPSVSSDGRWLLYTLRERAESDIVLVENFR